MWRLHHLKISDGMWRVYWTAPNGQQVDSWSFIERPVFFLIPAIMAMLDRAISQGQMKQIPFRLTCRPIKKSLKDLNPPPNRYFRERVRSCHFAKRMKLRPFNTEVMKILVNNYISRGKWKSSSTSGKKFHFFRLLSYLRATCGSWRLFTTRWGKQTRK